MTMRTSTISRSVFATLVLAAASACGPALEDVTGGDKNASDPAVGAADSQETIDIATNVDEKQPSGALSLTAGATAFQISLGGCASGYASTATEASPNLQAYKFDRGCLAKLTSFQFSGVTYVPSSGSPFTTWAVGDTATFVDSLNVNNTIRVAVYAQLSNPIAAADAVEYRFSQVAAGADKNIAASVVGASHTLAVTGEAAPDYQVTSVSFQNITAAGAGQFQFGLECKVAVAAGACRNTTQTGVDYKLVEDTFGSVLTLDQAATIFATAGTAVVAADTVAAGDATLVNGGFNTKTGTSILSGPDQMHLHPHMLLILRSGPSYQYFNVDVTTLTQL
jgi:hypothetical protein